MAKKNKNFVDVGKLNENEKQDGYYIYRDDRVDFLVNGLVPANNYINFQEPEEKYKNMLDKGIITESEAEERIANINPKVLFELSIKLVGKDGEIVYCKLGAVLLNDEGGKYIILDDKVTLTIDGRKYNNKFINLNAPDQKVKNLLKGNFITQEEADVELSKISEREKYVVTARFK